MKNKIFKALNVLLCSLVVLVLFGCNSNNNGEVQPQNPDPVVEPPKVEPKTLTYRYYTLEDDVEDLSFLEGYPWLNTSLVGMMKNIKRPDAKDDFYAYVNYDYLRNLEMPYNKDKYGGPIFEGEILADDRLTKMINDSTSPLYQINRFITNGDKEAIKADIEATMNYTDNDVKNFLKSKNVFFGSFGQLEITDDETGAIYVTLSGDYNENLLLLYYMSWYYDMKDEFIAGVDSIRQAEGIEIDNFTTFMRSNMDALMDLYVKIFYGSNERVITTVGQLDQVFTGMYDIEAAVKDLGYRDSKMVIYDTATLNFLNDLNKYVLLNGYDTIRNMLVLSKILYYRFYIGAEDFRALYKDKLYSVDILRYDDILDTFSASDMTLAIMKKRFYALLSKEYCAKYANNETRDVIASIIEEVIEEYKLLLQENDWLSEQTKANAIKKMNSMFYVPYYEDGLLEAGGFTTASQSLIGLDSDYYNYSLSYYDLINYELVKSMAPYTANAIMFLDYNGFVITHGIVSGFIDKNLSPEAIYGAIGIVIGHEISHGFDPTGAQYDENGDWSDWWTPEDKKAFQTKVDKMNKLYDNSLFSFSSARLSGSLVNGEVTADMGGLKVVLRIAEKKESFNYKEFFEAYANFYAYAYTYDKALSDISNNPHPLSYLRVNLTIAQFDKFQEVYDIKEGDGMYIKEEDRIAIW